MVNDNYIQVWSLLSGVCKLTLHGHQAAVTCVQFDKTKIISGALDTLIKIWNFDDGQVGMCCKIRLHLFKINFFYVVHVVYSNYGLDSFRRPHWSDKVRG